MVVGKIMVRVGTPDERTDEPAAAAEIRTERFTDRVDDLGHSIREIARRPTSRLDIDLAGENTTASSLDAKRDSRRPTHHAPWSARDESLRRSRNSIHVSAPASKVLA